MIGDMSDRHPAVDYVVVVDDADLCLFRSRGAAQSRLPVLTAWKAYDTDGRRLALTGGQRRSWTLGGVTVEAEHGRSLQPRGSVNDPGLRQLLINALAADAPTGEPEISVLMSSSRSATAGRTKNLSQNWL